MISDEQKREFLELYRQGYQRPEAAKSLGFTGSQFRTLCNPDSVHYDRVFSEQFKLIAESGEHQENFVDRLRAAGIRRALDDSDRLLEKYSLIYDPDWEKLQTQKQNINVNIESLMHNHFQHLNAAQIRQIIAWVKAHEDESIIDVIKMPGEIGPSGEEAAA